jgi:hypothetical protein
VIDDHVEAAGPERREDRPVHARAVGAHPIGVVIEEHVDHAVELGGLGRQRVVELTVDADHVAQLRGLQALGPGRLQEPLGHELVVLGIDHAVGADGAGQQEGRVAVAGPEVGEPHALSQGQEPQQLVGLAPRVELALRGRASRIFDDRADRRLVEAGLDVGRAHHGRLGRRTTGGQREEEERGAAGEHRRAS